MMAIETKYIGPTNFRGSRIKATCEGGKSVTIGFPHEFSGMEAHWQAAEALVRKLGWVNAHRKPMQFAAGGTNTGYVFVVTHIGERELTNHSFRVLG